MSEAIEKNWDERTKELIELALCDASESYEVDYSGVYVDPSTGDFVLLTASGCSCWDGDAEEAQFATFDEVVVALTEQNGSWLSPSAKGLSEMIRQVKESQRGEFLLSLQPAERRQLLRDDLALTSGRLNELSIV